MVKNKKSMFLNLVTEERFICLVMYFLTNCSLLMETKLLLSLREPQWTKDEKICGRCVSNEIQFHEDGDFGTLKIILILDDSKKSFFI